jgi:phosphatidylglycerophosphate synthase
MSEGTGPATDTEARAPALVLVPPPGEASVPAETMLLGLPLVRRTILAARRAGFGEILWDDGEPGAGLRVALDGTPVRFVPASAPPAAVLPPGSVHLPWNEVVTVDALRALRSGIGGGGSVRVESPSDLPKAESYLLRSLIKETDSFLAKQIDRKFSLAISRRLAGTPVTPNQMTLFSVGIGLAGALFFLSARPASQLAGSLLFLLHSFLDGCDGELARLRFQESRWGGLLDFWGDNVVHVAVFLAIGAGWSGEIHEAWPLWLGLSAAIGTVLSAGLVYRTTMREPKDGPLFTTVIHGPASRFSRAVDALARRDFIFAVVLFSAFGKASWFLVLAAVGSPLFFLVLLALQGRGRKPS